MQNCLGAQNSEGYWKLVDYVHAHAPEIGGDERAVAKANAQLDSLTVDEGKRQKVDATVLNACIAKQDDTAVQASMKDGESLGVRATPALFINGEKVEGALPLEYVYPGRRQGAAGRRPDSATAGAAASDGYNRSHDASGREARQLGKECRRSKPCQPQ